MMIGQDKRQQKAFTLIELLIVIGILGVLMSLLLLGIQPVKRTVRSATTITNLRAMARATISFAAENDNRLPSPQYPGGHSSQLSQIPDQSDLAGTGTGLWLDGVVYYAVYETLRTNDTSNGQHLRETVFASEQSFIATGDGNRDTENWYQHSYAMNEDIQHDHLYQGETAKLTNKTMANITSPSTCLLFIENASSNVIGAEDRTAIISTGDERWGSEKVHAAFVDGSARKLKPDDIPPGGDDVASNRFWKGVSR